MSNNKRDWLETWEVLWKSLVLGIVMPLIGTWLVYYHNREALGLQLQSQDAALKAQIENQQALAKAQRQISEAQLALGLLPNILKGSGDERRLALMILSSVAPSTAERVSEILLAHSESQADRSFIGRIVETSRVNTQEQEFWDRLTTARKYMQDKTFDAYAYRAYLEAYRIIPGRFRKMVDDQKVRQADRYYVASEFDAAAQQMDKAFEHVRP